MTAECPTPDKKRYRSQAEANRAERAWHGPHESGRSRLYPYLCSTGDHWHLTHYTPEAQAHIYDPETRNRGLNPTVNTFDGYDIRHVIVGDEPLWVGRDVCAAVGISKYRDALAQLDDDERASVVVDTLGGPQRMTAVTEAGVWSLMLISRSEKVKAFKRWLTHDVLPSIRKTGSYTAPAANIALPDRKTLAQWVVDAETRAELAEAQVRELAPAASAWNELADAQGDYSVADAAKVLSRDPNINTGERRLFHFMAGIRWVFKQDKRWRAYQSQVDNGRLVEKVGKPYWHEGRGELVNGEPTVRITPKGLAALHQKLGGSGQLELVAAVS